MIKFNLGHFFPFSSCCFLIFEGYSISGRIKEASLETCKQRPGYHATKVKSFWKSYYPSKYNKNRKPERQNAT